MKKRNSRNKKRQEIDIENIHYNIIGFNQITVMACEKEIDGKTIKLNGNDLFLLKWFYDIYHKCSKNHFVINPEDNFEYRKITYTMAIKAFPFFNYTNQTVGSIFKKFVQLQILYHFTYKVGGTYACFRINNEMYNILTQPNTKEEYSNDVLNKKLYTLSKILGTPTYYFSDPLSKILGNKSLLENTIGKSTLGESDDSPVTTISKKEKKEYDLNEYIEFWNTLSNTINHKRTSKTYFNASKIITSLLAGKFQTYVMKNYSLFDNEWFEKNKLSNLLSKKWNEDEIKIMFNNLNDFLDVDSQINYTKYWKTKPSLEKLLFNSATGKSLALCFAKSLPKKNISPVTSLYPDIEARYIKKAFPNYKFSEQDKRSFTIAINRFCGHVDNLLETFKKSHYKIKIPDSIYTVHADWCREKWESVKNSYKPHLLLSTNNGFWDSFISHLQGFYNTTLEPSKHTLDQAQLAWESEQRRRHGNQKKSSISAKS